MNARIYQSSSWLNPAVFNFRISGFRSEEKDALRIFPDYSQPEFDAFAECGAVRIMVVGREKRHHGFSVLLSDALQTKRHRDGRSAICGLRNSALMMNAREILPIERLVRPRQREQSPVVAEHRCNAIPRVGEKTLAAEEWAELFRARIAGDTLGQLPQQRAVSAGQRHRPSVRLV
jgi:hypothetical protein